MGSCNRTFTLTVITITLLAVPLAAAKPAPEPPGHMTRLLADHEDDWGGSTSTDDGHDLVALDLQERYDEETGEDLLVFRFILSGGYGRFSLDDPEVLRDVLTFEADGTNKSFGIATADNEAFNGTFDAVSGPHVVMRADGAPDAGRFAVEGVLVRDAHGIGTGTNLTGFVVQGFADDEAGDDMGVAPPADGAHYIDHYLVKGPVMYASLATDVDAILTLTGREEPVALNVTNLLNATQEVQVTVDAFGPVQVRFGTAGGTAANGTDDGNGTNTGNGTDAGNGTQDGNETQNDNGTAGNQTQDDEGQGAGQASAASVNVTLGPGQSRMIDLRLVASAPIDDAPVEVRMTTDLGGYGGASLVFSAQEDVPDDAEADADVDDDPADPGRSPQVPRTGGQEERFDADVRGEQDDGEPAETPGVGFMTATAVLVGLVAAAVAVRRRG